jgi:SAM-dependent methyltransferase
MNKNKNDKTREAVRKNYGKIAAAAEPGCGCSAKTCCGAPGAATAADISHQLGYSEAEVSGVPAGANLGLGCGNPQAIAALKSGETVLDLGSGAGFDCFLAAGAVGETGRVIGVDMTPEMLAKARENAGKGGFKNIDFRLGELENLPVADNIVDIIISNCVINLSPDKERVFHEGFRVLKPGGRLAVSDVVRTAALPETIANDPAMYSGCIAGASSIAELEEMLAGAGFKEIKIRPKDESRAFIRDWAPGTNVADYVVSATIEAVKPKS